MSELLRFWIYQKHSDGTKTLVSAEPVLASSHNNALWRYYQQEVGRLNCLWRDFKGMEFEATMVAPKPEELSKLGIPQIEVEPGKEIPPVQNGDEEEEDEYWWRRC